ncbi:MAG: M48 family peptidase, partial [Sulfurimonadaceae bacterium]|nr:M48 family peptidase [Sulfurimonadaceae bacterium]
FPLSHPIYIFFHYTHPPVLERLKALGMKVEALDRTSLEGTCQAII